MKARLTFTLIERGGFPRASTILGICKKALEATGRYEAEEVHLDTYGGTVHCLDVVKTKEVTCESKTS